MLLQLRLTNFRQHRDLNVDFTKGLNVIRGANERGKSTLLEGLCYVLFGISACRTPLDGLVTWGEAPASLKASLDFDVEGTVYRITRSARGAEVRYGDGQTVTGQKEVTAFVGRIFGVDSANINNLLLAGQGDIRGALSKGSTKTAQLIEDLANFDVIDKVVGLIGEKLLVGSPTPFEEKVGRLAPELAQCEAVLAEVPDTAEEESELQVLQPQLAEIEVQAEEIVEQIAPVAAERDRLQGVVQEAKRLAERQKLLEDQASAEHAALARLKAAAPAPGDPARLAAVQGLQAAASRVAQMRTARAEVEALKYPAVYWDQPWKSFEAEVSATNTALAHATMRFAELNAEAAGKRAERVNQTSCGLCAKDLSAVPEVVAKNAAIDARLAEIAAEQDGLKAQQGEFNEALRAYKEIAAVNTRFGLVVARLGELVAVDTAWVPCRLSWAGGDIPEADDGNALRLEEQQLQAAIKAVTVWQTQVESQSGRVEQCDAAAHAAAGALHEERFLTVDMDLASVMFQLEELNGAYAALMARVYSLRETVGGLRAAIQLKRAAYDTAKARVDVVREALDEANRDLDAVNFNNALLKRVRAARPVIANKLWSMVLSSVSRYFSQMRGEESVVTKDGEGFKVNGQPIESLSGSTLDLLGLSIRLSLVRSFLPHAPFLILDEPSAACDTARTEAMMGFLVSAGFDQMLIVTHEDMSEQVAENLIEI